MFVLEALKAMHGDCLLLHWGDGKAKKGKKAREFLALIDGGPRSVYKDFLKKRLEEIAGERGGPFDLDLTMVSHIDDDHIRGILDLTKDIEADAAPCRIRSLWHNSLEGLLNEVFEEDAPDKVTASVGGAFPGLGGDEWSEKVLASVPQGQHLHAFMTRNGLEDRLNENFKPIGRTGKRLVLARPKGKPVTLGGLSLTVIAPMANEIEKLRKAWIKNRDEGITAAFDDKSPYNLSSIVVLAEFGKKRMLLTGDARGDLVLKGLDEQGLLKKGKFHVDLLKLPHHGSQNNVTAEFFKAVTADVYVVSGDHIMFPNPHKNSMRWLAEAREGDDYVIYCTYDLPDMRKRFGKKLRLPEKGSNAVFATLA
jgi:glyoxylase-like metal-dependent hydrolase (beta-lactamase superfamily II)